MAQLGLNTRYRAVKRCDNRHRKVVPAVLLPGSVRKAHTLVKTSSLHLSLTSLDANAMEMLVEEHVAAHKHETNSAKDVGGLEAPVEVVGVLVTIRNEHVKGGSDDKNAHVDRNNMGFVHAVVYVANVLQVGFLDGFLGDIGEDTALTGSLRVAVGKLVIGDIHVCTVAKGLVKRAERSCSVLALMPHLHTLAQSVTSVQSTPHVTESLLVASLQVENGASNATLVATLDVALADGAHNRPASQVTVGGEEGLQVHVEILTNGLGIGIPTADAVDEFKAHGVNGGGRGNRRTAVEAGHASGSPENVGHTNHGEDLVSIAVKDNRGRVESRGSRLRVRQMHVCGNAEVSGREMAVS